MLMRLCSSPCCALMELSLEDQYSFDPAKLSEAVESSPDFANESSQDFLVQTTAALNTAPSGVHIFAAAVRNAGKIDPRGRKSLTRVADGQDCEGDLADLQVTNTEGLNNSGAHIFAAAVRDAGRTNRMSCSTPQPHSECQSTLALDAGSPSTLDKTASTPRRWRTVDADSESSNRKSLSSKSDKIQEDIHSTNPNRKSMSGKSDKSQGDIDSASPNRKSLSSKPDDSVSRNRKSLSGKLDANQGEFESTSPTKKSLRGRSLVSLDWMHSGVQGIVRAPEVQSEKKEEASYSESPTSSLPKSKAPGSKSKSSQAKNDASRKWVPK